MDLTHPCQLWPFCPQTPPHCPVIIRWVPDADKKHQQRQHLNHNHQWQEATCNKFFTEGLGRVTWLWSAMRAEWPAEHRSLLRKGKTLDTLEIKVWFEMQGGGGQWAILKHLHKSTMTFKPVEAGEEIQADWGIRQKSQGLSASFYLILREGVWRPWMRKKGRKINRAGSWIPQDFKTMIKGKCKWGTCPQKVRGKRFIAQWWESGIRRGISAPPGNPACPTPGKHVCAVERTWARLNR